MIYLKGTSMELSGTITIDDESKDKLMKEARKEVINDMMKDGACYSEILRFLNSCSYDEYASLIRDTIDDVIKRTNYEKDVRFDSDELDWSRLVAVQSIFKIG